MTHDPGFFPKAEKDGPFAWGAPGLDPEATEGERCRMEGEEKMLAGEGTPVRGGRAVQRGGNSTGWGEQCGVGGHCVGDGGRVGRGRAALRQPRSCQRCQEPEGGMGGGRGVGVGWEGHPLTSPPAFFFFSLRLPSSFP